MVEKALAKADRLDFNAYPKRIPTAWKSLREEAQPIYDQLGIWKAVLEPLVRS